MGVRKHYREDDEWVERVFERYERRRNLPMRQFRAAWAEAVEAPLLQLLAWLDRQLRRWPWLYRHLGG